MAARIYPTVEERRTVGEIIEDVVRDFGDIVRSELRLARAEITEKVQKAGKAAGLLGAAGICGLFAGASLVTCCIAALALAMPVWLAALLMSVFLVCIAAALYAGGRARLRRVSPVPEQTVETIQEQVRWAKRRIS
jgi:uncharacterized membrane protein YqjE